jgi:hypothetical protein
MATLKQPNFSRIDEGAFPVKDTNVLTCYRSDVKFTDSLTEWGNANGKANENGRRMCST